jgi:hypothetical protein
MTLAEYQQILADIPFGKRLPGAVYVFRGDQCSLGRDLDLLVPQLAIKFEVGCEFNVIKLRTDELKVSFLSYPCFFEDPHPVLRHAITIDLVKGRVRHSDYSKNANPPHPAPEGSNSAPRPSHASSFHFAHRSRGICWAV